MFGSIRFLLATSVMAFHLTATIPNLGILAVNFFYTISGYLMTLVLCESYQFKFAPFAANRFLRLYPIYFAIAAVGIAVSLALPKHPQFHPSWSGNPLSLDVIANLLMFPWAFLADEHVHVNFLNLDALASASPHYRVFPSTWSIGVEIVCYMLLWLFSARSLYTALATLILAAGWHLYVRTSGIDPALNYFPVPAALLPFAAGALAYHLTVRYPGWPYVGQRVWHQSMLLAAIVAMFVGNWYLSVDANPIYLSKYYYINIAIAFCAVVLINRTRVGGVTGWIDKWLGDIAYPMFLGHYVFAFIAWTLLGGVAAARGWSIFFWGGTLTILASVVFVLLVDRRLVATRNRVRSAT